MNDTGCSELVHWDDPEGWDGEGKPDALKRLSSEEAQSPLTGFNKSLARAYQPARCPGSCAHVPLEGAGVDQQGLAPPRGTPEAKDISIAKAAFPDKYDARIPARCI